VADIISAGVIRGGGRGPRASVNGHHWVEAGVMRGGGRDPEARIGSKAQVLNVKAWDPADNDTEVLHGSSVEVNVEALNSSEKDVHYDEGSDFETGVYSQTKTVGDGVQLAEIGTDIDFEDHILNANIDAVSQPVDWFRIDTYGATNIKTGDYGVGSNSGRMVRNQQFNHVGGARNDDIAVHYDGVVKARFYLTGSSDKRAGLFFRVTGSGSGLRGHAIGFARGSPFIWFLRMDDFDSHFGIQSWNRGTDIPTDTWFWVKVRYFGGSSNVQCQVKVWNDGAGEPASWQWTTTTSTAYLQQGRVGFFHTSSAANEYNYLDDFSQDPDPPVYPTSGNWESGIIDVTAANHYSHGLVTWTEVTPTNTTVAVKVRWPNGSWQACTNGAIVPGPEYESDMRAGSTFDEMELRIELATTDTSATPSVEDLRVYFEPGRLEEFEVIAAGLSNVLSDGTLVVWGRGYFTAGSGEPYIPEADWSDLYAVTTRYWLAADGATVAATLKYWGNTIDAITFQAETSKFRNAYLRSVWIAIGDPFPSGPATWSWTALQEWSPTGHDYYWLIIDKGAAIHADGYWICGTAVINDHPVSLLAGPAEIHDHAVSLLVQGYKRDDHPVSLLVQGWRLDDFPLSLLPGVWKINDQPVSILAAERYLNDHPVSIVVYGVDREGMIEVNIIADETWTELAAKGYTRS
jgi:hypothetical protein